MKRMTEMQHLRPAFAATRGHVLADLPVHCRLQRVFDGERAAFDKQVTIQWRETDYSRKGVYELRIRLRIHIGVGDLDLGRPCKVSLDRRIVEVRMIVGHRHRAEKSVKI